MGFDLFFPGAVAGHRALGSGEVPNSWGIWPPAP